MSGPVLGGLGLWCPRGTGFPGAALEGLDLLCFRWPVSPASWRDLSAHSEPDRHLLTQSPGWFCLDREVEAADQPQGAPDFHPSCPAGSHADVERDPAGLWVPLGVGARAILQVCQAAAVPRTHCG